jgi:hypothetical protein
MATFAYFAPQTGIILGSTYDANLVDSVLLSQTQLWKNLNWVRLAAFYTGGILLLMALARKSGNTL